ncbi:tryptophan synthase alpha chain [Ophiostoma piceae UAMH 11346]|uniref:Tryptophan synthase alpha chain n=1 Tax=Ophiostoma piceae (strain UAMH 11346) TaxID=1262450 RepID=S3D177_OPHP1|nr:tryptophan synthase alpha chain [Ophiostoma piceae UAMH 11346]
MRLQHVLALSASLGLASASKCKPVVPSNSTSSAFGSTGSSSVVVISASSAGSSTPASSESSSVSSASSISSSSASSSLATSVTSSSTTTGYGTTTGSSITTGSPSAVVSSSVSSISSTPESPKICQVYGAKDATPISSFATVADDTFLGCQAQCDAAAGCKSFSIEIQTGGACSLFGSSLAVGFTTGTSGPAVFFDSGCPEPVVEGPTIAKIQPTVTVPDIPTTPTAVVTFSDYTTPTITSSDSPPYTRTGALVTPTDDNEFISTYTWTEFPLTLNATGSPPVTTGIPQPSGTDLPELPCLITPGVAAPFTVLNQQFVPMVSTTGSVGPLLQPTEAPSAGDPLLDPANLKLPTFYLQAVDGADAYDLVYDHGSSPQYVAKASDGQVVFVDASTGPSVDGTGHVTTIFNIDCIGIMTITLGGTSYVWDTNGATSSIVAGDPASNGHYMKALPETMPTISEKLKNRKRTDEMYEKLMKFQKLREKRQYTPTNGDFSAPQCPSSPAGLVSKTKSTYDKGHGNLCDAMSKYWAYSPYDFGDACDVQSDCYDMCEGYSFQGCNAIFYASMLFTCSDEIGDEWWDVVSLIACGVQAVYYLGVAETSTGRDAYYRSLSNMCACFCSQPQDTCVYTGTTNFYCANLHSTDLDNCGGCGTQCGANSACKSGKCGCPQDQCGDTCLDLRSNPNNCGACGVVCDPHYCISGTCYKPTPGTCAPEQSVTNNMFSTYSPTWANWTVGAYTGTTLGTDLIFTPSLYTPASGQAAVYAIGVTMTNLPSGGFHGYIQQKNVKMCPGFNYDFKFNMGYVNQVNSANVDSSGNCYVRWLTGKPTVWSDNGGFQSSPNYNIGVSNPTYATFGPWTLNIVAGQTGVTKVGYNYYVDLTAVISCDTPVGSTGHFVITGVEMTPTTVVSKRSVFDAPPGFEEDVSPVERRADTNGTVVSGTYYPGELVEETYVKLPAIKGRSPLSF